MGSGFGFPELEARSSGHDLPPMLDEDIKSVDKIQRSRLAVYDREIDDAEALLHRREFVEIIEHDVGYGIALQFQDDPHAFSIRFIAQVRNAFEFLIVDKLGDALEEPGFIDLVWDLGDYDGHSLCGLSNAVNRDPRPHHNRAPACFICLSNSFSTIDETAGRKVRTGNHSHDGLQPCVGVLNQIHSGFDNLVEVVRRDIGRHSNGDSTRAVYKQIRISGGKYDRLFA